MPQTIEPQPATLNQIIRIGWKQLALADQTDADEMLAVLKDVLEELERLEAVHGQDN